MLAYCQKDVVYPQCAVLDACGHSCGPNRYANIFDNLLNVCVRSALKMFKVWIHFNFANMETN